MKMNLLIIILAFFSSCGSTNETSQTPTADTNVIPVAETPSAVTERAPAPTQNMIVGKFSKEDLEQAPYATWFNKG